MWISPKNHKIVGAHLAALRRSKNITQVDLAKHLKKPQSFVSSFERGQRRVDLLEFASIVLALNEDPRSVSTNIFDGIGAVAPSKRARSRT